MSDLQRFNAKVCYTAAGLLIHEDKVLFIKHKKLGMWFAPGGHIDEDELPHQAAEREFWEETGVRVRAYDALKPPVKTNELTERLPRPILVDLHWVSQENYHNRLASDHPKKRSESSLWPRGCEQHLGFLFMVAPVAGVEFSQNIEETDGIAWFTKSQVHELRETTQEIKDEVDLAFLLKDQ